VGPTYAARGANILQVLAVANIIRLSLTPYVVALIGTGQQRLVMLTPLMEGFSNLIVSVGLGYFFGAIGVALGTLCGSVVVFIGNIFYNMPRTTEIQFQLPVYLRDGFLRPFACAVPGLIFVFVIRALPDLHPVFIVLGAILAAVSSILCFWRWGLLRSERHKLRPRLIFAEGAGGS
jgi:O-antigen/teichoic acid export membrane protein